MDIAVQHAELIPGPGGTGVWKIAADVTIDGVTDHHGTIMPLDCIEWRVAQFNVSPREALEMVMIEPYARDEMRAQEEAPTRSQAREIKRKAISDALDGGSITWPTGEPTWTISGDMPEPVSVADTGVASAMDLILNLSAPDDEIIVVKREALDLQRARTRAYKMPTGIIRPSAEELRARLLPRAAVDE